LNKSNDALPALGATTPNTVSSAKAPEPTGSLLTTSLDLVVGQTLPIFSNSSNGVVTWQSGNTSCAMVDGNGYVTGVRVGTTTVRMFVGGFTWVIATSR